MASYKLHEQTVGEPCIEYRNLFYALLDENVQRYPETAFTIE
jgi:hypothetical protein